MNAKIRSLMAFLLLVCIPVLAEKSDSTLTFQVKNPNYKQSPYTGMTRQHWKDAALYLLDGAFSYIHQMDDAMKFPKQPGKSYPQNESKVPTEKLEGLCRTLFIADPLLKENPNLVIHQIRVADYYRYQIKKLLDPTSSSYIKPREKNGGPSQNLVEFGALAVSLFAIPEILWEPLTQPQKDSLARTMLSYGEGPTIASNWKFFNIFVMSFFKSQGYTVNDKLLEEYLKKSLEHYQGDGWYNDHPAFDYYSMWAFQMYGVLWSDFFGKKYYPAYAAQFNTNFKPLKDVYPYLFSRKGEMIMWGRSMSYRFGAAVPFPLMGLEKDSTTNYGWMRRISSGTLLQFLQNPDFLKDQVPTLGFYGPFEPAVQSYSCRGSAFWSGKVFLGLLIPEKNAFWTSTENEGAWEKEMSNGEMSQKFLKGSGILITDYPAIGASEIRAWCNVPVRGANEPFRGSENYNRLSYNSAFPWQADGKRGEVSMNYVVKNAENQWEPLRLYTFKKFEDGIYYREVVLESNKNIKFNLADIPLKDGILRVDLVEDEKSDSLRLGHYSLPQLSMPIKEISKKIRGHEVRIINNGEYQLAMISIKGWKSMEVVSAKGLHPRSEKSKVIDAFGTSAPEKNNSKLFVTLMLWKKANDTWENKELIAVKKLKYIPKDKSVLIYFTSGETKWVRF